MSGELLFTVADLENRVGQAFVKRVLDDDGAGAASESAVNEYILESSATVWAALPKDYELPAEDDTTQRKRERPYLKKLALDYAYAALCQRHPEFQRVDALEMMKLALKSISEYGAKLAQDSEEAADEGGGGIASGSGAGVASSCDPSLDWYR